MSKPEILQFADMLKWEFFTRLKDETAPAGKEFSYVDLLDILDVVCEKAGISKENKAEYEKIRPNNSEILFAVLPPELLKAYNAALSDSKHIKAVKQ